VTAEVSEQARVNFVPRASFLRFLRANPGAVIQVAQILTDSHFVGHEMIQSLGLSRSASEKLARFFLSWSASHARGQDRLQNVIERLQGTGHFHYRIPPNRGRLLGTQAARFGSQCFHSFRRSFYGVFPHGFFLSFPSCTTMQQCKIGLQ
jgi:hypothetical protein